MTSKMQSEIEQEIQEDVLEDEKLEDRQDQDAADSSDDSTDDGEDEFAALAEPDHVKAPEDDPQWPEVKEALKEIYDPEIPVNIYELGLIYSVKFHEEENGVRDVDVVMTLTSPGCPVAQEMPVWVKDAIFPLTKIGDVEVDIVWDPPWDPSMMAETAKMQLNMFT